MKRLLFTLFAVASAFSLAAASAWEGSAVPGSASQFPDDGLYAACNSFPRGSTVEVRNLETGTSLTVSIIGPVDNPGIFMTLSPKAAEALGMKGGSAARIRASAIATTAAPVAEPAAAARATAGVSSSTSRDPDFNPALLATPERVAAGRTPVNVLAPQPAVAPVAPVLSATPPVVIPAGGVDTAAKVPDTVEADTLLAGIPGMLQTLNLVLAEPSIPIPAEAMSAPAAAGAAAPAETALPAPETVAEAIPGPEELPEDILVKLNTPARQEKLSFMAPEPLEPSLEAVEAEVSQIPEVLVAESRVQPVAAGDPETAGMPMLPELAELIDMTTQKPRTARIEVIAPALAEISIPPDAGFPVAVGETAESLAPLVPAPEMPRDGTSLAEALPPGEEASAESAEALAVEKPDLARVTVTGELDEAIPVASEAYPFEIPEALVAGGETELAEADPAAAGIPGSTETTVPLEMAQIPEETGPEALTDLKPIGLGAKEETGLAEALPVEAEAEGLSLEAPAGLPLGEFTAESPVPPAGLPPVVAVADTAVPVESPVSNAPTAPQPLVSLVPAEPRPPVAVTSPKPVEAAAATVKPVVARPGELPARLAFVDRLASGRFYVQVGVYSGEDSIAKVASGIATGFPLSAERVPTPAGERIRLYVGPLGRDEGGVVLLQLKSSGYKDAFIRAGS